MELTFTVSVSFGRFYSDFDFEYELTDEQYRRLKKAAASSADFRSCLDVSDIYEEVYQAAVDQANEDFDLYNEEEYDEDEEDDDEEYDEEDEDEEEYSIDDDHEVIVAFPEFEEEEDGEWTFPVSADYRNSDGLAFEITYLLSAEEKERLREAYENDSAEFEDNEDVADIYSDVYDVAAETAASLLEEQEDLDEVSIDSDWYSNNEYRVYVEWPKEIEE